VCCILFLFFNLLTSRTLSLYSTGATGLPAFQPACLSPCLPPTKILRRRSAYLSTLICLHHLPPTSCLSTLICLHLLSPAPPLNQTPTPCLLLSVVCYTQPPASGYLLQPKAYSSYRAAGPNQTPTPPSYQQAVA
jgi:hypothetical protein